MKSSLSLQFWIVCLWTLSSSYSNASAFSSLAKLSTTAQPKAFLNPRLQNQPKELSSLPIWAIARGGDQEEISLDDQPEPVEAAAVVEETVEDPEPVVAKSEPATSSVSSTLKAGVGSLAIMGQQTLGCVGKFYTQNLDKFPILTKSCTAGVIFGLSDFLAQKLEHQSAPVSENKGKKKGAAEPVKTASLDWTRLMASSLVGLLYFGPAAHYWYEAIFRLLPGTSMASTLQKAFWGQVIFGPSFNCIFFATSLMQAGKFSLRSWGQKIRSDLPGAWLAGAGFWPLVDVISYSMVPIKWIPLFVNFCSLIWTIYLSIVANRDSKSKVTSK